MASLAALDKALPWRRRSIYSTGGLWCSDRNWTGIYINETKFPCAYLLLQNIKAVGLIFTKLRESVWEELSSSIDYVASVKSLGVPGDTSKLSRNLCRSWNGVQREAGGLAARGHTPCILTCQDSQGKQLAKVWSQFKIPSVDSPRYAGCFVISCIELDTFTQHILLVSSIDLII